MKIFLDTNILLDLLVKRDPWGADAAKLCVNAKHKNIVLFTSDISISNCLFMLRARYKMQQPHEVLNRLLNKIEITSIKKSTLQKAFNSSFADKEDAIQYFSALENNIGYIITRDLKGFAPSEIPVLSPKQFIKKHLS